MRKGTTFDTGFRSAGTSTREPFDPEIVRREMRIIRDDMPREPKAAFTALAEYYGG